MSNSQIFGTDSSDSDDDDDSDASNTNINTTTTTTSNNNNNTKTSDNDDDDESDDSDDDSVAPKNVPPPSATKSKIDDDDDDDDGSEDEQEFDENATKPTNATITTTAPPPSNNAADSSSDDDAEFDEKNDDIIGSTNNTESTQKMTKTTPKPISSDVQNAFADSDSDNGNQAKGENGDDDGVVEVPPKRMTVLTLPNAPPPTTPYARRASDKTPRPVSYHTTQLPSILAIQPKAFYPETYRHEEEERMFDGNVHGMIRWRYRKDASGELVRDEETKKLVRESNTKLIRWSDGSYGLSVGDEIFDMDEFVCASEQLGKATSTPTKGAAAGRGNKCVKEFLYLTQKARYDDEKEANSDDSDDEEQERGGTVLECASVLTSKFLPRVATLQSQSHKNFVLTERNRTLNRRAKIEEIVTIADPEKEKMERIRDKSDMAKAEDGKGGGGGGGRRRRTGGRREFRDRIHEDDGEYDTYHISKAKKRSLGGYDDNVEYDSDSGEEGWAKSRKRKFENERSSGRRRGGRRREESEESEQEEEFFEEEEEDEEEVVKKSKRTSKAFIEDDDDDDDD